MPSRAKSAPKQKATVAKLANDTPLVAGTSHVAREILVRVKKCFDRANHANANETEAQAAMKMASRMMTQHNITQAQIIEDEDLTERQERGGLSTVEITPSKDGGQCVLYAWTCDVINAVLKFFDCSAYSTKCNSGIEWTFYGIAEHTVSAAIAFEMVHNLMLSWADVYVGVSGRNSYCLGVARGLCRLAEREIRDTEIKAKENGQKAMAAKLREEELERQKAIARLMGVEQPSAVEDFPEQKPITTTIPLAVEHESSRKASSPNEDVGFENHIIIKNEDSMQLQTDVNDDSDRDDAPVHYNEQREAQEIQITNDFEADLETIIRTEPKAEITSPPCLDDSALEDLPDAAIKIENEDEPCPEWASLKQLALFRESTQDIEEGVLRSLGVKPGNRKKRKRSIQNEEAYQQGRKDSKRVNIRMTTIEDKEAGDG